MTIDLDAVYKDVRDIISLLIIDATFAMPIVKFPIEFWGKENVHTDGKIIYINPELWMQYSKQEKKGLLLRTWIHIAFFHPQRRGQREKEIWLLACAFMANMAVIDFHSNRNLRLPPKYYYDHSFSNNNTEEIYAQLLELSKKDKKQREQDKKNQYSSNKDQISKLDLEFGENEGNCGLSTDDSSGDNASNFSDLKHEIVAAADYAKKFGNLPNYYERAVTELRKSQSDWKTILSSLIKETTMFGSERSFSKPKKWAWQYKIILPGETGKKYPTIVVIYDTSGSISQDDIAKFNGELAKMLRYSSKCTVITADAEVHEQVQVRSINDIITCKKVKFHGGGGTDFRPALIAAAKLKPDICIYLTDGFGAYGTRPQGLNNLIWAINNTSCQAPPFGRYVRVID